MLTVPFSSVLNGVFHHAGLDPSDASDPDKLAVIQYIADRFKTGQEYYKWPVYCTVEQRFFRDAWSASTVYSSGAEVYFAAEDAYYTANQATSAGQSPDTHPAKWTALTDFNHQVDYVQTGKTAIAAVTGAWDEDPRSDRRALELERKVRQQGIGFSPDIEVSSVWLEFRPRATDFAAVIYDATAAYAVGAVVYFPLIGDVYTCATVTAAGQTPATHPAKWTIAQFPEFLARAVKVGAYADWLEAEDRPQAAGIQENKFIDLLEEQVWQLTKLQGQTGRPTVSPAR